MKLHFAKVKTDEGYKFISNKVTVQAKEYNTPINHLLSDEYKEATCEVYDVPDIKQPLEDWCFVQEIDNRESSIIIPEDKDKKNRQAIVLAHGNGYSKRFGQIEMHVKVGDIVAYHKDAPLSTKYKGCKLIRQEVMQAILR